MEKAKTTKKETITSKSETKDVGLSVKKSEDFSEWYTQVVLKSELADYSIVSGCMVIRPLGMAIWDNIRGACEPRLKKMGVQHTYFPLFIPESLLKKEAAHVEGFAPEVAWVTQGGDSQLAERYAVRPTSEAIMYDSYSKWIRSHRDLPLKLMQWNNVVRWEFKHPTLLLRTREFLWVEGHTAFATREEADREVTDIMKMWKDVCEDTLALPYLHGRKTDSEKFAGAEYTESLEFFVPNGRVAQGPDAHSDGQNFAKAYDIKFIDKNNEMTHAWQNTWAISTRMVGVLVTVHSDDKGLVVPPKLHPLHAVIVPIFFDDSKEAVLGACRKIKEELAKFSIEIDDRDGYSAGYKFNHWELRGVPIRIEIGPKDLAKESGVLVRRDTGDKQSVLLKDLANVIPKTLEAIHKNLFDKAKKLLSDNLVICKNLADMKRAILNKKLLLIPWCEEASCEASAKAECEGSRMLNLPMAQPKEKAPCAICGKPGKVWVHFGKSY